MMTCMYLIICAVPHQLCGATLRGLVLFSAANIPKQGRVKTGPRVEHMQLLKHTAGLKPDLRQPSSASWQLATKSCSNLLAD
jgi:hypothetical protein